jgi:hypothetical protein
MLVRFVSYLGKEGFGEQFQGEYELGGVTAPCTIRWAVEPRGEAGKDNPLARVRDSGLLMQTYPDPLVPRVLAVVPCWNGLAVVSEAPAGRRLADIEERPLPERVILEIVRQVCLMLDRVYTRKDANTGEMLRTLHRAISTECIFLRPDGAIRVTGFEKMSTVWSARAAETSALATHPGARLAPEQMAGEFFHATDVYLAGLVAVDLLVNPERASQTARMLAMCICDPEGFEEIRESVLADPAVEASANLRGLLRSMLQEDPKSRPSGHIVASMASAIGASETALAEFCCTLQMPPPAEGLFHQFIGRTLELPDPQLRPMAADDDEGRTEEPVEKPPEKPAEKQPSPAARPTPPQASPAAPPTAAAPPAAKPAVVAVPVTRRPVATPPPLPEVEEPEVVEAEELEPPRPAPRPAALPPAPPPVASITPRSSPAQPASRPAPAQPAPAPAQPAPGPVRPAAEPQPAEPQPAAPRPAPQPTPPRPDPDLPEPMPEPIRPSVRPPEPVVDMPLVPKPAKPEPAAAPAAPTEPTPFENEPAKKSKLPLVLIVLVVLFLLGTLLCCGGLVLLQLL